MFKKKLVLFGSLDHCKILPQKPYRNSYRCPKLATTPHQSSDSDSDAHDTKPWALPGSRPSKQLMNPGVVIVMGP